MSIIDRRNTVVQSSTFARQIRDALTAVASEAVQELAPHGGHGSNRADRQRYLTDVLLDETDAVLEVYGPGSTPAPSAFLTATERFKAIVAGQAKSNRDGRLTEYEAELLATVARKVAERDPR